MLRVREAFEIALPGLRIGDSRVYEVAEQVFEASALWSVRVLAKPSKRLRGGATSEWRRLLFTSTLQFTQLVQHPGWARIEAYVILPQGQSPRRDELMLARCHAVWSASIPDQRSPTWVFETSVGDFQGPSLDACCTKVQRQELIWQDGSD